MPVVAGEDVVVAEERPRRDAGRVVRDVDAVDRRPACGRCRRRCRRRACRGSRPRWRRSRASWRLLSKTLATMTLLLVRSVSPSCGLRRVAGVVEARVGDVDAAVDDRDLHAGAGVRLATDRGPRLVGVDEREIGVVVGERAEDPLQLGVAHHRRRADRGERRAVELHADGVDRDVELAGDACLRRVGPEPAPEVVADRPPGPPARPSPWRSRSRSSCALAAGSAARSTAALR